MKGPFPPSLCLPVFREKKYREESRLGSHKINPNLILTAVLTVGMVVGVTMIVVPTVTIVVVVVGSAHGGNGGMSDEVGVVMVVE